MRSRGIMRAIWANLTTGGVAEGGSTITQQLAKNAYLTQERTIKRKVQEMFLALQLEREYTKQEILEYYLNQIYFGDNNRSNRLVTILFARVGQLYSRFGDKFETLPKSQQKAIKDLCIEYQRLGYNEL